MLHLGQRLAPSATKCMLHIFLLALELVINRKQDLSPWQKENLGTSSSLGTTHLGSGPCSSVLGHVTLGKAQLFLSFKTITTILSHVVLVRHMQCGAAVGFFSAKCLLGAWPVPCTVTGWNTGVWQVPAAAREALHSQIS